MAVINLGSMNLDHIYSVPHFVVGAETLLANGLIHAIGGKGLNQSIAAARSGVKVYHAGRVGVGGGPLEAFLKKNGVDTTYLSPCDATQGHTVIQLTPSGQNCILVYGGSNQQIDKRYIEYVLPHFQRGDYLLLQNEISNLAYAVEVASRCGLKIVLNASPITDSLREVDLSKLEWLAVNETECMMLAGCDSALQALEVLAKRHPRIGILLTLGEEGSMARKNGNRYTQVAYPSKAVDTTGAGDTFTGFFVGYLERRADIQTAMRIAAQAASIAVSHMGAAESIPMLKDVLAAFPD